AQALLPQHAGCVKESEMDRFDTLGLEPLCAGPFGHRLLEAGPGQCRDGHAQASSASPAANSPDSRRSVAAVMVSRCLITARWSQAGSPSPLWASTSSYS